MAIDHDVSGTFRLIHSTDYDEWTLRIETDRGSFPIILDPESRMSVAAVGRKLIEGLNYFARMGEYANIS